MSAAAIPKTAKGAITRERIITAAADLIHTQGYHATGLNQIIKQSGTPKGSLYFHFPEGKDEIIEASILSSGDHISGLLQQSFKQQDDAKSAIENCLSYFKSEMSSSNFHKGCPVATVALEAAGEKPRIQQACSKVYQQWLSVIERGLGEKRAEHASIILTLIEGALVLAKATRSTAHIDRCQTHIFSILDR